MDTSSQESAGDRSRAGAAKSIKKGAKGTPPPQTKAPTQMDVTPSDDTSAAPVEHPQEARSSQTKPKVIVTSEEKLVIEISEFTSINAANGHFGCQRRVRVLRHRSLSRETRRPYPRGNTKPVSRSKLVKGKSPAAPPVQQKQIAQQTVTLEAALRQLTSPAKAPSPPQSALPTSNRFAALAATVEDTTDDDMALDDIDQLGSSVVDPLASSPTGPPSGTNKPAVQVDEQGSAQNAQLVPVNSAQVADEWKQLTTDLASPPAPTRLPITPSMALVPYVEAHAAQIANRDQETGAASPSSPRNPLPALPPSGTDSTAASFSLAVRAYVASLPQSPPSLTAGSMSGHSTQGALTTPSWHFASDEAMPPSAAGSFYERSLEPTFQEGGSDRENLSNGDESSPLSPLLSSDSSAASTSVERSVVLAGRVELPDSVRHLAYGHDVDPA